MPYESFKPCHRVRVCDIVRDATTSTWRYVVRVERSMEDTSNKSPSTSPVPTSLNARRSPSARLDDAESFHSRVYTIERTYADFKRLHRAIEELLGDKSPLVKLPDESLLSYFISETQHQLEKRRTVVDSILDAIQDHPTASQSVAFLEFLDKQTTDSCAQQSYVLPPRAFMLRGGGSSHDLRSLATQRPRLFSQGSNVDNCVELMRYTTLN